MTIGELLEHSFPLPSSRNGDPTGRINELIDVLQSLFWIPVRSTRTTAEMCIVNYRTELGEGKLFVSLRS
jgi:hypothetical protein